MPSTLHLTLPSRFNLSEAVCSYGYFVLAPNLWVPRERALYRPLRLPPPPGRRSTGPIVIIKVTQRPDARLRIACNLALDPPQRAAVKAAVARILRLDEDFTPWYRLHPAARRRGFARLFRSPSLFEDMVKTITGQNVTWTNTRSMNRLLCEHVGRGAFPTPAQLAGWTPEKLSRAAKVGYRADRLIRLARRFVDGSLAPAWFESPDRTGDELYHALLAIHGVGPYAAANLCMLLGRYNRVAIDTETYRHYCKTYRVTRPKDPKQLHDPIEAHYHAYAPYDFLAYWFDLWVGYERVLRKRSRRWTYDDGGAFTVAVLKRHA